jgi:hypothetical protein
MILYCTVLHCTALRHVLLLHYTTLHYTEATPVGMQGHDRTSYLIDACSDFIKCDLVMSTICLHAV